MSSKYALPAFVESTSEPHVREQAILPGGGEPAWTLEDAPPFKVLRLALFVEQLHSRGVLNTQKK